MVARYKRKRLAECRSTDRPCRDIKFEGSERQKAKREIKDGLSQDSELTINLISKEEEYQREAARCYLMSEAYPDTYVCECFYYHPRDAK